MNPYARIALILIQYIGFFLMAFWVDRTNFLQLIVVYSFLFAGYFVLIKQERPWTFREIFWTAILFRSAFLLAEPALSDDYFRFIWDGRVTAVGENPYLILPSEFVETDTASELGLTADVYDGLNSQNYYTIYPPVNQLVFAFSSWMGLGDPASEMLLMHLVLLLFDSLLLLLIPRLLGVFNLPRSGLILYAFNPLIVIEFIGNLHFEGMVLSMMALSLLLWLKHKRTLSAIVFGIAVSTKLLPLMILPLFFRAMGFKRFVIFCSLVLATFLFTALPFIRVELIMNWWSSIELYFQSFEFNASVYYFLRYPFELMLGYNPIQTLAPVLSLVTVGTILVLGLMKKPSLLSKVFIVYTLYFLMTTTVHPWYIGSIVLLGIFTRNYVGIVWSFAVVMSYSHYMGGGFEENYLLIGVEYTMVFLALIFRKQIQSFFEPIYQRMPVTI